MKTNVGKIDRILRLSIVAIIAGLIFTQVITGTIAIVFGVVASIILFTAVTSWCGVYALFGANSCEVKK